MLFTLPKTTFNLDQTAGCMQSHVDMCRPQNLLMSQDC